MQVADVLMLLVPKTEPRVPYFSTDHHDTREINSYGNGSKYNAL